MKAFGSSDSAPSITYSNPGAESDRYASGSVHRLHNSRICCSTRFGPRLIIVAESDQFINGRHTDSTSLTMAAPSVFRRGLVSRSTSVIKEDAPQCAQYRTASCELPRPVALRLCPASRATSVMRDATDAHNAQMCPQQQWLVSIGTLHRALHGRQFRARFIHDVNDPGICMGTALDRP